MSKAFISFIDHKAINHKFYLQYQLSDGSTQSTCFWSGMYPQSNIDDNMLCAKFAEKLFCYDTCLISIDDYLFLIHKLGISTVKTMLKDGCIEVFENQGLKVGIGSMKENDPLFINIAIDKAFDSEKYVIEYQRIYGKQFSAETINEINRYLPSITSNRVDDHWCDRLKAEITNDLSNKSIISNIGLLNGGKIVDRDNDYNQIMYNRVAHLNLYLAIGNQFNLKNIVMPEEIQSLLDAKIGGYLESPNNKIHQAFGDILEFSGIYDTFNSVLNGHLNFDEIMRIRNHKKSIDFRQWLNQTMPLATSDEFVERYNIAIIEGATITRPTESNLSKTLKFAIPKLIGFVPIVGTTISNSIDISLYLKDLKEGRYKPSMFVEDYFKNEIHGMMYKQKMHYENQCYIRNYGKIPVNSPCPCKSNLKYKKCHGRH